MKALFIIHCQDPIYGANRSLSAFIRNFPGQVDLVFAWNRRRILSDEQIHRYFGPRVGHVWFMPQVLRLSCLAAPCPTKAYLKSLLKDALYLFFKPWYNRLYKQGGYDFIHLNSAALYPMLDKRYPMFLHVREIVQTKPKGLLDRGFAKRLSCATGLICISKHYRLALPPVQVPCLVLSNPFDQTRLSKLTYEQAISALNLNGDCTIYAILGTLTPAKGVLLAIQGFLSARLANAVLLIVGNDAANTSYIRQCKEAAAGHPGVQFTGELENTDNVYRAADYILRADTVPGPGRTVYEGLFSGCSVITQGDRGRDLPLLDLPGEMESRVWFYQPNDEKDLARVFSETNGKKAAQRQYLENTAAYADMLLGFIEGALKER